MKTSLTFAALCSNRENATPKRLLTLSITPPKSVVASSNVASNQAAPLVGWELPEEFAVLRRLLESRMDQRGKREFVQVLRLMENFRKEEVHSAVRDARRLGAVSFDAVRHLVLCRIEGRPPRLDMELYPYLPRANVTTTSTRDYMTLLAGSRS